MNLDTYPVESSADLLTHTFYSEGPRGRILKRVEFQLTSPGNLNLAFGDWNREQLFLDDFARSNNNDMTKVLATVAKVVDVFLQANPDVAINIAGSTLARTRLYQMKIFQHLRLISERYIIAGVRGQQKEVLDPGYEYSSFSITTKLMNDE